ncbi:MAG: DUF86 domain-containing protein [Nanoarchaeota archaeon]
MLNFKIRAIGERYFEKIVEAVVDVVFLVIRREKFKIPESDENAFEILAREKIISQLLSEKLQDAKRMRNVIAHYYGKIDNELVYHALTEELTTDVEAFISHINNLLIKGQNKK